MLFDQIVKIYYADKTFQEDWSVLSKEEVNKAKSADIIITRDGKVAKDRWMGYNFKGYLGSNEPKKEEKMNDKHTGLDDRRPDEAAPMGIEATTLVPIVVEADGKLVTDVDDGEHVDTGEVIGYVQVEEDA